MHEQQIFLKGFHVLALPLSMYIWGEDSVPLCFFQRWEMPHWCGNVPWIVLLTST